jgi:hypothetical protein
MLKINEFEEILDITVLISQVLDFPGCDSMPNDVTEAVRAAKKQMEGLPQIIDDLNLAYNRYLVLSKTINRMSELALYAGNDTTILPEERMAMEDEFRQLAHIIAREAGQVNFEGTSLSLSHPGTAKAAYKVLSYLIPVVEALDYEIKGHKSIVVEALAETINFMGIVARCYPEARGIENLKNTLEKIQLPSTIDDPIAINPTLH